MTHLALPSSFTRAKELYWKVPEGIQDQVCSPSFDGILDGLLGGLEMLKSRLATTTTLIERWSNWLHTFHFQFREMTITTLDFATIIGFTYARLWIPFAIPKDLAGLCHDLMGCLFEFKVCRGSLISYDQL